MKAVNPYLNFAGHTEEAFNFYQTVFGGELHVVRFGDFPDNPMGVPEEDLDKIAHVALPLTDGSMLMGTDTLESLGQQLTPGNNFSITLETESAEEAEDLHEASTARHEASTWPACMWPATCSTSSRATPSSGSSRATCCWPS